MENSSVGPSVSRIQKTVFNLFCITTSVVAYTDGNNVLIKDQYFPQLSVKSTTKLPLRLLTLFFSTHSSCFSSVFLVSNFLFIFSASLIVASLLCPLLLIYPSSISNLPARSLIFLSSLPRCLWATYPSSCTVRPLKYGSGFIIYLLSLSLFYSPSIIFTYIKTTSPFSSFPSASILPPFCILCSLSDFVCLHTSYFPTLYS